MNYDLLGHKVALSVNPPPRKLSAAAKTMRSRFMWLTIAGGALGLPAGSLTFILLADIPFGSFSILRFLLIDPTNLLAAIIAGLLLGGIVGALQSYCLQDYLTLPDGWWTRATALAGAASGVLLIPWSNPGISPLVLFPATSGSGGPLIGYVVVGTMFGLAQWLVLRTILSGSGMWILTSATGGFGGVILTYVITGGAAIGILTSVQGIDWLNYLVSVSFAVCFGIPFFILIGATTFLPLGVLNGLVLVNLTGAADRSEE